ncbi:helix-turn-helix transcriptional regulator [Nonomuraea salmonea]|uniref:helix-turn-helix transcriptional regulator n=1 Tax=Nonomuraea salmonea TaxID=46181 RepID=UPI003CD05455
MYSARCTLPGAAGETGDGHAAGALLRGWRKRALLTQEQLAEKAGLNVRTVRRLESGGAPAAQQVRAADRAGARAVRRGARAAGRRRPWRARRSGRRAGRQPDRPPASCPPASRRWPAASTS